MNRRLSSCGLFFPKQLGTLCLIFALSCSLLVGPTVCNAQKSAQGKKSSKTEILSPEKVKEKSEAVQDKKDEDRPLIQIALLLDTSNSMDGLINQAKAQLWTIVNDLAETKKDGKVPKIQVAFYEYGNSGIPATKDYIRKVVPMTDDLDKLSQALFALKTNGGDEYCGQVIFEASRKLDWSPGHDHYKAIFIAGNEPFTQGNQDYSVACSLARSTGIIVNTIHCGNERIGIRGKWKHGAEIGGGKFLNINSDKKAVIIKCPQDVTLRELNIKLNKTYLYYGANGKSRSVLQAKLDHAQEGASGRGGLSSRIAAKGNASLYGNAAWDLLDKSDEKSFDLSKIVKTTLPEKYRKMTDKELKDTIAELKKKRREIQKQITAVAKARAKFIAEAMKKRPDNQKDTFGRVLQDAALKQAGARGFKK